MKKLVRGIVDFRQKNLADYREKFGRLAHRQSPDALFIACSDSRVAPNAFASTDPGDLFVIRNVGNLIPHCGHDGHSTADESEAAAIEFALLTLNVSDIIVCGHSDCGAMRALVRGRDKVESPNLKGWLRHGETSLSQLAQPKSEDDAVNQLSKLNVLQQLKHLRTYPEIEKRINEKKLGLHAWWFELTTANVYCYSNDTHNYTLIDENSASAFF